MIKKKIIESAQTIQFTNDNVSNIGQAMALYRNILICGVGGVGKISNTVQAVKDNTNVYYLGNPFDYEGKMRPGSYEKYLKYIHSLKKDIMIIEDIESVFKMSGKIILIIDEIFGRSESELAHISKLLDMENIQTVQIVGCMKNMGSLIDKIDMILELHHDVAFSVDKDLARSICKILGKKQEINKLF